MSARFKQWGSSCISTAKMIWRRHVHEEGRRWNTPLPLQRRKCLPRALNNEKLAFSRPGSAARCKPGARVAFPRHAWSGVDMILWGSTKFPQGGGAFRLRSVLQRRPYQARMLARCCGSSSWEVRLGRRSRTPSHDMHVIQDFLNGTQQRRFRDPIPSQALQEHRN